MRVSRLGRRPPPLSHRLRVNYGDPEPRSGHRSEQLPFGVKRDNHCQICEHLAHEGDRRVLLRWRSGDDQNNLLSRKWLAFVPHFQQERLARFLIRDIRALHYLEDLLRLFAQCT
jgi:hypothetical protein